VLDTGADLPVGGIVRFLPSWQRLARAAVTTLT
jgi:hypothetical protein